MKKIIFCIVLLVILGSGYWWWRESGRTFFPESGRQEADTEAKKEFCYFKSEKSADSPFEDKHSLEFTVENGSATGELRLLPAEKDALVGTISGTLSGAVPPYTLHGWWNTEGEGMTATEELNVIFDSLNAKIGLGEMMERDGKYVYKDPTKVDYSLVIPAVSCGDFHERENVEKYLWENIVTLSPVAPVVGGSWYVVSATIDLEKNTGTVVYEDGHIQEKRDFYYQTDASGSVTALTVE